MAVAAVSRDTMRSSSPPAATLVAVSRYARLFLVGGALIGRGSRTAGRIRLEKVFEGLQHA